MEVFQVLQAASVPLFATLEHLPQQTTENNVACVWRHHAFWQGGLVNGKVNGMDVLEYT